MWTHKGITLYCTSLKWHLLTRTLIVFRLAVCISGKRWWTLHVTTWLHPTVPGAAAAQLRTEHPETSGRSRGHHKRWVREKLFSFCVVGMELKTEHPRRNKSQYWSYDAVATTESALRKVISTDFFWSLQDDIGQHGLVTHPFLFDQTRIQAMCPVSCEESGRRLKSCIRDGREIPRRFFCRRQMCLPPLIYVPEITFG